MFAELESERYEAVTAGMLTCVSCGWVIRIVQERPQYRLPHQVAPLYYGGRFSLFARITAGPRDSIIGLSALKGGFVRVTKPGLWDKCRYSAIGFLVDRSWGRRANLGWRGDAPLMGNQSLFRSSFLG